MPEYKIPTNAQEFEQNFSQLKPLMKKNEATYESSRCLFCFDAPCIKACPTGIDIPLFIRQINDGNTTGAARTIYEANYFGNACGKVCPTEVLCEGACVYNLQDVKPIEIGRLQSFATHTVLDTDKKLFSPGPEKGKKVAVIGAGPAGISCACELRAQGFEVDIYEGRAKPSGLTYYGVAPYKITDGEAMVEMNWLQSQFGYSVFYETPIQSKADLDRLEEKYDAVFIAIGLGKTGTLGIPGEDKDNCVGAVEFIEELRMRRHQVCIAKTVVVLGGGNTAMDAASESARLGAEHVVLAYRRAKEEMGAYNFEYDLVKGAGVEGLFNAAPLEILGNGRVTGVKFIKTELVGNSLKSMPGTEFIINCDLVIKATGQQKQVGFLELIPGLNLDSKGRIIADPLTMQTANPKYFAAGDALNGGAEVVNAAAEGKAAAFGIAAYLKGNGAVQTV